MKNSYILFRNNFEKDTLPIFSESKGIYLKTQDGKTILDGCSNSMNVNLGYSRKDIVDVICDQALKLPFMHNKKGNTIKQIELAEKLVELLPTKEKYRCYFCSNGSDSIEAAMRVAFNYCKSLNLNKKKNFAYFSESYHGSSMGALSVTGVKQITEPYDLFIKKFNSLPFPNCVNCEKCNFSCIDEEIVENSVAIIIDSMITNSFGCKRPSIEYFNKLRDLCKKYNTVIIADEIATSIGRTGKNFCFEYYEFIPDIVCISKGIGVGYVNLGAILVSDHLIRSLSDKSDLLGHTYNGSPIACAVGLKVLDIIKKENILENVCECGNELNCELIKLKKYNIIDSISGLGLMYSISFNKNIIKKGFINNLVKECFENGLLILSADLESSKHITIAPPLIITKKEIKKLVQIIDFSIANVLEKG